MIVLNSLRDAGAGFGSDTNKGHHLPAEGNRSLSGFVPKAEVARDIVDTLIRLYDA